MPNKTKKAIIASIVQKTGVKPAEAKRAFETILVAIKLALADGSQLDLGKKLGKLRVVSRNRTRRINRNLKNRRATIEDVHKNHPKTIKLVSGKDFSKNPQPTIVHKPEKVPASVRSFATAVPRWRRRPNSLRGI